MLFLGLLVVAVAAVSASPTQVQARTAKLSMNKVSHFTSIKNVVSKGQARVAAVNGLSSAAVPSPEVSSGTVTNEDVSYVAPIVIGGKTYELIVDTGSSNTWCGAATACEKSSTGTASGGTVSVSYGSGSFSGTEYTDTVSFGGLTVTKQSIGSATKSTGFSGVDGIIGFGPVVLTEGTVSGLTTVPTFMDNLKTQGSITSEILGVYFKPESGSDTADANGELTLGGVDTTKYTGTLTYFPKATSGDASYYWGISIARFTYGTTTLASSASGIVDTGTTLIYIPTSAYNKFLSAAGGATDSSTGLARFSTKPTSNFVITFGTTAYTLTPDMYLVPTAQYSVFGLTTGKYYAWINDGGASGVNTIIGQKFLENFYSVFDTTNSRIGFATAA
ncbi:aspartic peptidase domain-containing protein [Calycina marina]|uniref:Aspartic peptidase domain-containing protein n=1 Tax=Calycina marina TaxID=1763456 RepID=A0A9P8CDP1_9HELO|nr:aspartic peptidase domain-containing protein [Calycina marina]